MLPLRPPPPPLMLTLPPTGSTVLPRLRTRSTSARPCPAGDARVAGAQPRSAARRRRVEAQARDQPVGDVDALARGSACRRRRARRTASRARARGSASRTRCARAPGVEREARRAQRDAAERRRAVRPRRRRCAPAATGAARTVMRSLRLGRVGDRRRRRTRRSGAVVSRIDGRDREPALRRGARAARTRRRRRRSASRRAPATSAAPTTSLRRCIERPPRAVLTARSPTA